MMWMKMKIMYKNMIKNSKLKERNISIFKILVMILLKTLYQKNTDIFEQVYKMLAQTIKCSLKKCYLFIICHMNKLRLLFEKQLMNYLIGRNMDNENLTIVMSLWMLTHYFNKRMLEITDAV